MARTIATMKAPVAANRLNFELAIKNTSSGPSSVASLNSGCGWVLSISCPVLPSSPAFAGHDKKKLRLYPCNGLRKIARGERRQIVDAFADADEMHRQFEFLRERHQNAAARGAVELRHHEAGDPR